MYININLFYYFVFFYLIEFILLFYYSFYPVIIAKQNGKACMFHVNVCGYNQKTSTCVCLFMDFIGSTAVFYSTPVSVSGCFLTLVTTIHALIY